MKGGLFLYRWFKNISIAPKLYFTVGIMALLIGLELLVLLFCLSTLSSLRAYVGGEGLWSKAQKDAVFHLSRYGVSRSDKDYQLFRRFMLVPLGDAKTRRELLSNDRNMDAAREGFLEGRNHPDDVDGMIKLFVRFYDNYYIKNAILAWGNAQDAAMQLLPVSEALRQEINSASPSQTRIDEYLASVYSINEKVTAFEDQFSFTLGEGSRWLEKVVFRLLFGTALAVETTGLLLVFSVSRGLQKGLANIIGAANLFSAGDWGARARVLSRDEIGIVATAFNEMASRLQLRIVELARVNQSLRHEIDERERAQADLRRVNENLEIRVTERTSTLTHLVDALQKEAKDRERAEAALRQSQKMEAVGQLTGGIAHDFNNMLAGISGSLELIRRRLAQSRTADLGRYIEAALTSAARAAALTHRLLAFSRRQTLDPKPTDVNRLVLGMGELFKNTLGPAVRVETRLAIGLWRTLCDSNQLENGVLNLTINARDAMRDGGLLVIETANATIPNEKDAPGELQTDLPPGDYVKLAVSDTGIGMSQAVLDRAFDPFFTTKPLGQGTGLGLSMVYGFVQQSGGRILLRSKKRGGTTVTIYLPRHFEAVKSHAAVASALELLPTAPVDAVVLVVEDELDIRMVVVDLLEDLGYVVLEAGDGAAGLTIVNSTAKIDLLVSDVGLPGGMNGRELADAARQRRPGLKVLFITGYSEGFLSGGGLVGEGIEVMTKPFLMSTFAKKVQDIVGGGSASTA
jgi:signal transduction histidine kinase/CheY-like chemotaxis protein